MSYTGAGYVGAVGVASYLKSTEHGGLVQPGSIAGSSGGFNTTNLSAQQRSIISGLDSLLVPTGYTDLKKLGTLDKATVNVLSELGIKPNTRVEVSDNLIKEYNDRTVEKSKLAFKIDELNRYAGGRTPDLGARANLEIAKKEMNVLNNIIESMTVSKKEKSVIESNWLNFLLPPVFAVEDPSISSGLSYDSFEESEITLPSIYGGQYVPGSKPVSFTPMVVESATSVIQPIPITTANVIPPEQKIKCPARVQIVSNITNVVAGEGEFNCATIEKYTEDPDYRIVYMENGFIPTPEPEITLPSIYGGQYVPGSVPTTEEAPGTVYVPPEEPEPEVTTDHVEPPGEKPEKPTVTVTPTEPGQVNWIPEPFFSFINNVFRR